MLPALVSGKTAAGWATTSTPARCSTANTSTSRFETPPSLHCKLGPSRRLWIQIVDATHAPQWLYYFANALPHEIDYSMWMINGELSVLGGTLVLMRPSLLFEDHMPLHKEPDMQSPSGFVKFSKAATIEKLNEEKAQRWQRWGKSKHAWVDSALTLSCESIVHQNLRVEHSSKGTHDYVKAGIRDRGNC
jgi:hypothetical protein